MKKQEIQDTNLFKFFIPIFIVWGIITIFKAGYGFGQWLQQINY